MEQVVKHNGKWTFVYLAIQCSFLIVYLADMKDFAAMNEVHIDF